MKPISVFTSLFAAMVFLPLCCALAGAETGSSVSIQVLIDEAAAGAVVVVPVGTHAGPVVLKDGVTLAGETTHGCILDGGGSGCVVRMGNDSTIMHLTVRNSGIGIWSAAEHVNILDCSVSSNEETAICIDGGYALIANNRLCGNGTAVFVADGARADVVDNLFEHNGEDVVGGGAAVVGLASSGSQREVASDGSVEGQQRQQDPLQPGGAGRPLSGVRGTIVRGDPTRRPCPCNRTTPTTSRSSPDQAPQATRKP